jgi:hypothetical protein
MRKRSTRILALGVVLAVVAVGIATAGEQPTVVRVDNVVVTFDGGVTPKRLPRNELAPIAFNASGKVKTTDGSHLPALEEVVIEADKNSSINAKGLPVCTSGKLQAQDTKHAEEACKPAIVGEGITDAEVEFPEQPPFVAHSKLLAFNGGVKGGVTTLYIHAYFSAPVSGAIVTTVKVSKIHKGRFGLKSVATIPKIAGGYGSVKAFSLTVGRSFTYKGKKQSYLLAKCPDGHLNAHGTAVFQGGPTVSAEVVRSCTPTG